ncbi:hypothetical protein [Nocardia sp. NBC_01329]|uniref:hypothetical protein n=1 Tax=Nocardia sp. NBC_01329 TaxID=2903594 RepID=UPI002E11E46C|nr:hypothetical protein OG405_07385 [Nocardia sp. NBC_01329]
MSLGEVAADLYGLAPGDFVAARDARAAAARESGDRELAAAISALRKPTVAGWTVNMLVRAAPGEVDALLRLGADLRTAQRQLSGEQLRELTRQRRQVVDALTGRAGELVAGQGRPVSDAVLRQVSETLTAALADPEIAERVRTGTLVAAETYAGFGPVEPDLSVVRDGANPAVSGARRKTTHSAESAADQDDREARVEAQRQREQERARAAEAAAQEALTSAELEARQAAEHLGATEARLAELRDELTAVEARRRFARNADRAARDAVRAATVEWERARRRLR